MPGTQMKFYVDIPNFDNLSRQEKSLINFIMKHGALVISGNYDENTHELNHITGAIRLRSQNRDAPDNRFNGYDVFIPYVNQWVDDIDLNDGLPDYSTHLNNVVSTYLKIFKIYDGTAPVQYEWQTNYRVKDMLALNIAATVTPKIGNVVNTDSRYMPVSLPYRNEYPEQCCVPIDLTNTNLQYDFQLRTPTFTVKYDLNSDIDTPDEYTVSTGEFSIHSGWFSWIDQSVVVDDSQYRIKIYVDIEYPGYSDILSAIDSGLHVSLSIDSNTEELVFSFVFTNGYHGEFRVVGNPDTDPENPGTNQVYYWVYSNNQVEILDANDTSVGYFYFGIQADWSQSQTVDVTIYESEFQAVQNISVGKYYKYVKQADLFYKIGVFNAAPSRISTSEIVSQLIGKEFNVFNQGSSGYDLMVYRVKGDSSTLGTNLDDDGYISDGTYTRNMSGALVRKSRTIMRDYDYKSIGGNVEGLPNTMLLPLGYIDGLDDQTLDKRDRFDLIGFLYFELYDGDNKPFADEVNGCIFYYDWELYKNDGYGNLTQFYISTGYNLTKMLLTNEHVDDGAFIEWVQQDDNS